MRPGKWKPDTWARRASEAVAGVRGAALAKLAVQEALALLGAYARTTDNPPACIVDVADLLDVAANALDGAP